MNIQRRHLIYLLIAIIDMALILCSYFLASFIYLGDPLVSSQLVNIRALSWHDSGLIFLIVYSIFLVSGYSATKVFGSIYLGRIRKMVKSVAAVNLVGIVLFAFSFYVFNLDDASRILVFLFYLFSTFFVCFANWIAIHLFRLQRNSKKYKRNVLVVGCGHLAREYAQAVGTRSSRMEHVIGYVDPSSYMGFDPYYANGFYGNSYASGAANANMGASSVPLSWQTSTQQNCPQPTVMADLADTQDAQNRDYLGPCLGTIQFLDAIFQNYEIDEIALALDVEDYACVRAAVAAADKYGVALSLVPFYNDIIPRKPNIDSFGGVSVVDLRSMPLSNPLLALLKRAIDIVVSIFVILITSWLMIITAIGVKASSPGPVFFKQLRMGEKNKTFEMLKFRSMRINEESEVAWSTNEDPRKTRFGSFIRKYSIDELPQFFNVLKGDMSIVGPRPEIPFYVQQFRENVPLYMLRHQVRPGITGLAQISGLRGDTSVVKRIELDIFYIQHWSIWLDCKIFFKTLFGGFVNDEVLAESGFLSKLERTEFGKACLSIHESAIDGALANVFNLSYMLIAFIFIFSTIYINPFQDIIPHYSFSLACKVNAFLPNLLICIAIVIWACEARKMSFWILAIFCWIGFDLVIRHAGYSVELTAIFAFVFAYPKTLKIDKIAGVVFAASAASILTIVCASIVGAIPDHIGFRDADIVRHSMGFISPNAFATAVTACLIPYVYFRLRDWRWYDAAFCLIVGFVVYMLSWGRMSIVMLVFLVALACICRFDKIKRLLSCIAPWVVVCCFIVTVFAFLMYWQGPQTTTSDFLNRASSGRFQYVSAYLNDYSPTLFGQVLPFVGASDVIDDPSKSIMAMDSSYMNIFLGFGILGTVLLILPSIWLGKKAQREKYTSAIFVIAVIAIFSITENFYYNVVQNFGIFIMGYFISAWATKRDILPERASAPIDRSIDWVNMKGSRWRDFLEEE